MTIDELKSNLKKISPQLKLDVDFNEPLGVWYESSDSDEDDLELFRIDENDFYFEPIINEIYEANSLIGSDTVKEVGDLLFKYFEPELSKESQKISNDSKNKNSSTAALDKFLSKDSQKKTKEKLIYDFIDEAMDHGFTVEQTWSNHKIDEIEMEFNDSNVIQNFNISFKKTDSNKKPFYLMINDALDAQHLLELSWLFDRASELVSNLRGKEKALKEMGAQK